MAGGDNALANGRAEDEPADDVPPAAEFAANAADPEVSHNLNGQKLGRKGRGTRDRIIAATVELLASEDQDEAISMSAVARRAALGMTSLYNYFTDFTEVLLAVLEPVIAESEARFTALIGPRWADEELAERCYEFVCAYHEFWSRNTRLLHLRNSLADGRDQRMMRHRVRAAQPIMAQLVAQMDDNPDRADAPSTGMATVLMTGLERTVTVSTDRGYMRLFGDVGLPDPDRYLRPEARLLEMAIRDTRRRNAGT
jgi:AcrR family transcriptional regulator